MRKDRLFDFIFFQAENAPLTNCLAKREDNVWRNYSTKEVIDLSEKLASGLLSYGLKKGDKVGIISYKNRPEWTIVDLATQQIGLINVPIYPTISPREYAYIFNDSSVKVCFVGAGDLYEKVDKAGRESPSLQAIFSFDNTDSPNYWERIFTTENVDKVRNVRERIKADDLATIIYTSGTTGNPKGVMLSHENMASIVRNTEHVIPPLDGKQVLSFLPLCHIFERTVSFAYMHKSAAIHYTGTDNLGGETGDLQDVKPYFFTTVPRLLEKVYEKIYAKGLALKGLKRKLFFWALSLSDDYEYDKEYSGLDAFKRKIADRLIYSKWRQALGGNVKGIVTGAAPLPEKIARVFSAAGIPVREGYGLTEASPTLTINLLQKGGAKIGTVGPAIPEVDLLIDESEGEYREGEGEILAAGPNIMIGYHNLPEQTAEVFKFIDGKKYLRTGDVGKLVTENGGTTFLKITDRKKELLKTSGGKYVAPAPIENKFKEDSMIEQIMVVGDQKKFVSAIIVPSENALADWCKQKNIEWTSLSDIIKHPEVLRLYQDRCDKYSP